MVLDKVRQLWPKLGSIDASVRLDQALNAERPCCQRRPAQAGPRSGPEDGQPEKTGVAWGVRHGLVRTVQVEVRDLPMARVQKPGPHQPDHAGVGLGRTVAPSSRFGKTYDIRGVSSGQKLLAHPSKGVLRFLYASFQANDDPALKLAIYTPMLPSG